MEVLDSPAAASAAELWEASPVDTTATSLTGVPAEAEAAVADGIGVAATEEPGDGVPPTFLGATTTLLKTERARWFDESWATIKMQTKYSPETNNILHNCQVVVYVLHTNIIKGFCEKIQAQAKLHISRGPDRSSVTQEPS